MSFRQKILQPSPACNALEPKRLLDSLAREFSWYAKGKRLSAEAASRSAPGLRVQNEAAV
jgi:hypothetical protein